MNSAITVTQLKIYPVKGLRGIDLKAATIMARGLEFDREWMVVDANYSFITQRDANVMATIETAITPTHLVLKHESMKPLHISLEPDAAAFEKVKVWKDHCLGVDQGDPAAEWLSEVLRVNDMGEVRLMRFAAGSTRHVEPDYLGDVSAEVGFADAYPYLVANEATLEALNSKLAASVPMNRFRPNIVLRGLPALDEHRLDQLTVPTRGIVMLLPKPCQRCKVTTIDQQTGEISASREPLRTLVRSNTLPGLVGGFFGQNAIAIEGLNRTIHVDDAVEVTYT